MVRKEFILNRHQLKLAAIIEADSWNRPQPFVMLLPGFKGYKEEKTYSSLPLALMEHGIGSIRFDASGFGESEGTLKDDYRFSNYVSDTETVYQYLREQAYVTTSKIGVCGQSMGGLQAVIFVSRHPEIKCLVSISPPNIIGQDGELHAEVKNWQEQGYLETVSSKYGPIRVPFDWLKDAQKFEGAKYSKQVKVPSLYILGTKDTTVTPQQTRMVFAAANEPKQLVEISEMDHFYKRHPTVLTKVNAFIIDFLARHLS